MSIRKDLAEAAVKLKSENKMSYEDMCGNGNITRKQVSAILQGNKGVSIELIERVFKDVFNKEIAVVLSEELC